MQPFQKWRSLERSPMELVQGLRGQFAGPRSSCPSSRGVAASFPFPSPFRRHLLLVFLSHAHERAIQVFRGQQAMGCSVSRYNSCCIFKVGTHTAPNVNGATRLGEHDGSSLAVYWQLTARHETWSLPMAPGMPLRHIRMAPWDRRASVLIALVNCPR